MEILRKQLLENCVAGVIRKLNAGEIPRAVFGAYEKFLDQFIEKFLQALSGAILLGVAMKTAKRISSTTLE